MKIIKPSIKIITDLDSINIPQLLESIGRTCYKSEDKINKHSAKKFVQMLINHGHESVLEHFSISVRIICDRGVSHELVRHRLASYSQESTRYCNYANKDIEFIAPCWYFLDNNPNSACKIVFENSCVQAEVNYNKLIAQNLRPQDARAVLPNSLKTEIVMTANLREWRHFFKLRATAAAHPDMQYLAKLILKEFNKKVPVIFEDIYKEVSKCLQQK